MRMTPYTPEVGEMQKLPYGGVFKCLEVTDRWQHNAIVRNIDSGWTIEAHHIRMREDGFIEWDYSTGGIFTKEDTDNE